MKEHLDRETQNSNYWKEKYLEMQSSTLIPNLTQDKKKESSLSNSQSKDTTKPGKNIENKEKNIFEEIIEINEDISNQIEEEVFELPKTKPPEKTEKKIKNHPPEDFKKITQFDNFSNYKIIIL